MQPTTNDSMQSFEAEPDEEGFVVMLERVCEALIFATDEPISADQILSVFHEVTSVATFTEEAVENAVERLNAKYELTDRMFKIHRWAGGYRMATVKAMEPYLRTLFQESRKKRLSRSLMETLAVLAYRQPATKPEIEYVRGVGSDYALRRLMELGIVDVVGRSDTVGRPLLYGTTQRFLDQFGINSLDDLPNLREIEELLDDPAFKRERARLIMEHGLIQSTESTKASD